MVTVLEGARAGCPLLSQNMLSLPKMTDKIWLLGDSFPGSFDPPLCHTDISVLHGNSSGIFLRSMHLKEIKHLSFRYFSAKPS